jgi:2-dehydropantoate 2-reductase
VKVCVFGAGAIGGYVAVQLVRAGVDVTVIARGTHLEAIRRHCLTLETSGERRVARVPAVADPAEAGAQDVVIVSV